MKCWWCNGEGSIAVSAVAGGVHVDLCSSCVIEALLAALKLNRE